MSDESKPAEPEVPLTLNQQVFLEAIRQAGYITHAAKLADMERQSHYRWLKESPTYAEAFKDASQQFDDLVRSEVVRRGILGLQRIIYYRGEPCGMETEYSDRLLEMLAKSRCPEFHEKHVLSTADDKPIEVKVIAIRYPEKVEDHQKWMDLYKPKDKPAQE